jgi:TolA-binding protein
MLQPIFKELELMGFTEKNPIRALQFLFEQYQEVNKKLANLSGHFEEMLDKSQEQVLPE